MENGRNAGSIQHDRKHYRNICADFCDDSGSRNLYHVSHFCGNSDRISRSVFLSSHRGQKKVAVSAVIFVLCCGLGYSDSFAFWQNDLSYEGESIYNYLQVSEDDRRVILSTNVLFGVQSLYMKDGGLTGMYYDYAMAAPLMIPVKGRGYECSDPWNGNRNLRDPV